LRRAETFQFTITIVRSETISSVISPHGEIGQGDER
jgi:hypothetical protein